MSDISESEWKIALVRIVEDLKDAEYSKLMDLLDDIPQSKKPVRNQAAQVIIEHYILERSIMEIDEAMKEIPRLDARIQDKLRPFVEKVKAKEKENKSKKRKPNPKTVEQTAGNKKPKMSQKKMEETAAAAAGGGGGGGGEHPVRPELTPNSQRATVANTPGWRKPIRALKESKEIDYNDAFGGKVIYKSKLLKSQNGKDYFCMTVIDETDNIKMAVYGRAHYKQIQERKYYLFRKVKKNQIGVKVIGETIVGNIPAFDIPEEVEKKARSSEFPFLSIQECKTASGTVTVEGTVKEINQCEKVEVKSSQKTVKKESFCLEDGTGSITVYFWEKQVQQRKTLCIGDVIKLTGVKIDQYLDTVSLKATCDTELVKVKEVGTRTEKIRIVGLAKCQKRQTVLTVELDNTVHQLVVSSKLLAEAFGFNLEKDYQNQLFDALPLLAEAQIYGNKIKKITRSQD